MCWFKNGSQWDYNVNHMHLRCWQGFIANLLDLSIQSCLITKSHRMTQMGGLIFLYKQFNPAIFFCPNPRHETVVILCYCWMNYLPLLFGLVPFNSQTYLGIPVLSCGMLDKLTLSGFLNNVTLNFALRSGSSKQGKARLASVGSNWVVAK